MIKTVLKHWIYEGCLHMFFDAIGKNFNMVQHDFRPGRRFRLLHYWIIDNLYNKGKLEKCKIYLMMYDGFIKHEPSYYGNDRFVIKGGKSESEHYDMEEDFVGRGDTMEYDLYHVPKSQVLNVNWIN